MFTKWINEPKSYKELNDEIEIIAGEKTDFFIDPTSNSIFLNAPIYVFSPGNDFTFSCKIKPFFNNTYDAGAIFLYINDKNWIKLAFENTDMGQKSVVTVVTNGISDDANGEKIIEDSIWLKMIKQDEIMGLYFSFDKENWKMVRLFKHYFEKDFKVFIGIEAQSPLGKNCKVIFKEFDYNEERVGNLRKGI